MNSMKLSILLAALCTLATDATDPDMSYTAEKSAYSHVNDKAKKLSEFPKDEEKYILVKTNKAYKALEKEFQDIFHRMRKNLDKFFKEQTYNLDLMINMGHRLGIDHKATVVILIDLISSGKTPAEELVKKSANKDADKKELAEYLSLQYDLANKVLNIRSTFRNELIIINDKARLSMEEIDLELNDMIIKLFKQKINNYKHIEKHEHAKKNHK